MTAILKYFLLTLVLLGLNSCEEQVATSGVSQTVKTSVSHVDAHTYSNIDEIRTKHLHLELDVNFENKTIYGVARHEMEMLKDADTAIFDINGPEIQKVTIGKKGQEKEGQGIQTKHVGKGLLVPHQIRERGASGKGGKQSEDTEARFRPEDLVQGQRSESRIHI